MLLNGLDIFLLLSCVCLFIYLFFFFFFAKSRQEKILTSDQIEFQGVLSAMTFNYLEKEKKDKKYFL